VGSDADALRAEVAQLRARLEQAERTIAELQVRDRATGLFDGRETLRLLRIELDRCRRYDRRLSLVLAGVTGYAGIVDRLGRQGADQVLARVARACRSGRRSADVVGRLEDGQFALVLPETAPEGAAIVADHVRRGCEGDAGLVDLPTGRQVAVPVRLAFGVVGFPGGATDADGLVAAARRTLG
jgi:diguanylate cyclase (GGDEF)-like protein